MAIVSIRTKLSKLVTEEEVLETDSDDDGPTEEELKRKCPEYASNLRVKRMYEQIMYNCE